MNRLCLSALSLALTAASIAAKADTIINLNATVPNGPATSGGGTPNSLAPSFYSTQSLTAGTYSVSVIGVNNSLGSVYNGWSYGYGSNGLAGAGSWSERTGISFNNNTFTNANGNDVYTVGGNDKQFFSGNYTDAPTALAANISSLYTFTLASTTNVTFYIPDNSYPSYPGFTDNTGGVSLDVKAVTPEPSSIVLLGTGVFGLAGAIKRRMSSSR